MNENYIQREIEEVEKNKIQGKGNAKKNEQKLKDISDYLDSFFGPVSEESIREFEKKYGNGKK